MIVIGIFWIKVTNQIKYPKDKEDSQLIKIYHLEKSFKNKLDQIVNFNLKNLLNR